MDGSPRPYPVADLATLLAPISVDSFYADHLGRAPLHVRGDLAKLDRLIPGGFTADDVVRGIAEGAARRMPGYRLLAHRTAGFDSTELAMSTVLQPADVAGELEAGGNIQVVDFYEPRVMTLLARLKTQLGAAGEALLLGTMSPVGFGWPMHLDKADAIFIQCAGRKEFVVGDRRVAHWPRGSIVFDDAGVPATYEWLPDDAELAPSFDPTTLARFVLEPGDMLYCPAGFIHGTKALDRTVTLGLAFEAASPLDIIRRHLDGILRERVEWRHVPPRLPGAPPGELTDEIRSFLAARIEELKLAVAELTPEALKHSLHKSLAYPGEGVNASLREAPELGRPIAPEDVIVVGSQAPLTWTAETDRDGTPLFHLFCGDKELTARAEWVPFFRHLVEIDRFRADQASTWSEGATPYPWSAVQQYLQALLENGVVVVA